MNQTMTITKLAKQELQTWSTKAINAFGERKTSPFAMRFSSDHHGWFYLIEKSEKLSIWRKGNTFISIVYPRPFLYFSIACPAEGQLIRLNQKNIAKFFAPINEDSKKHLKTGIENFKYGKPFLCLKSSTPIAMHKKAIEKVA